MFLEIFYIKWDAKNLYQMLIALIGVMTLLNLPEKTVHNATSIFWESHENTLVMTEVKYLWQLWWMQESHWSLEQAAKTQTVQHCFAAVRAAGFSLAAGDGRADSDETWN